MLDRARHFPVPAQFPHGQTIVADKGAANDNATIRLNDDRVNVPARSVNWIKTQVNAAVSVKPGEIESRRKIDVRKLPADNDAAIALQRQGEHHVDPATESECLIDTAIRIQPANAIVGEPIEAGETAGHNDPAIGLKNSGSNFAIRARPGIEAGVERAIEVEACDPIAKNSVGEREPASGNHFAVGLGNDDIHRVVCPGRRNESGVELPRRRRRCGRGSCGADCANRSAQDENENKENGTKRRAMHQGEHSTNA